MSYTLNNYDGTFFTTIQDGELNKATDIGFPGDNYIGFGQAQNSNFLWLLNNFAGSKQPKTPVEGQLWYSSNEQVLKVYDNSAWNYLANVNVVDEEPISAIKGQLWFKTSNQALYVYSGYEWVNITPSTIPLSYGITSLQPVLIADTENALHPVIKVTVAGIDLLIVSNTEFIPLLPLSGFPTIFRGATIASNTALNGNLNGNASTATKLKTPIYINGFEFDGSADINITSKTPYSIIPGSHIIGYSFDGSSEKRWDVDATDSNVPGKIVSRTASGNFSANNITATNFIGTLKGNVDVNDGVSNFNEINVGALYAASIKGDIRSNINITTGTSIFNNVVANQVTGYFVGNLTGNVTGNILGNITSSGTSTFNDIVTSTISGQLTGNATTATGASNLIGGSTGDLPYQTGSSITDFLAIGTHNQILRSTGSIPQWSDNKIPVLTRGGVVDVFI